MKWKLWLRKLSVSAPNVSVRTQFPWPLRALIACAALAVVAALGIVLYEQGRTLAAPDRQRLVTELDQANRELERTQADRDRVATAAVQWENQLQVERVAKEQVRLQLKSLEEENARLKSELSFFESLLPTGSDAKGVVIRSFRVQPDSEPNSLRYRLLVQQSGRPERDFVGMVSLIVNLQRDGRSSVLELPDPALPDAGPAPLAFRHYQRVEGSFTVPEGAVLRSVQVRIQSGGETRAQQTFSM